MKPLHQITNEGFIFIGNNIPCPFPPTIRQHDTWDNNVHHSCIREHYAPLLKENVYYCECLHCRDLYPGTFHYGQFPYASRPICKHCDENNHPIPNNHIPNELEAR